MLVIGLTPGTRCPLRLQLPAKCCQSRRHTRGKPARSLATSTSGFLPSTPNTTALKEWAVTIGALGAGLQTVLLRKGGIREPTFRPEATNFLLFPTSFHSKQDLLKPGIAQRFSQEMMLEPREESQLPLGVYAQLTGAWVTDDRRVLAATDALHVWGDAFLEARLKWRPTQPMTVLELRVWRLAAPLRLEVREELFGCFSWVDVAVAADGPPDLTDAVPALADDVFRSRQLLLRAAMAELGATPLDLGLVAPAVPALVKAGG